MATRGGGRGRGRGQLTFNMEAVGIGKGDALPPPTLKPSPLFPVSFSLPFPRLPCAPHRLHVTTESSWPIIISCPHFDPVFPESQPTRFQANKSLFFLFIFPSPQLSKDAALASQSSGPLFTGNNGFSLGERPFKVFTVALQS